MLMPLSLNCAEIAFHVAVTRTFPRWLQPRRTGGGSRLRGNGKAPTPSACRGLLRLLARGRRSGCRGHRTPEGRAEGRADHTGEGRGRVLVQGVAGGKE